jgi:hypothetical protein
MATSTLPEEVDAEEESAAKIAASPMIEPSGESPAASHVELS